ncbi:MAG: hypothetical protein RLZZ387_2045 [Chloroflexota bacterium]
MTASVSAGRQVRLRQGLGEPWRFALRLHAGYLALFVVWTAWSSSAFPRYVEEARLAVWPPSAPLGAWLERVVLLPLYRYDVIWYVGIAEHGYGHRPGDTAFHPLYPLLMALLGRALGGGYLLAGWLVAQLCCVAMIALLYRLVLLDHDEGVARRAAVFLIGSPLGFSFLLPYTESLLLLCIVGAIYAGRRGRWWLAGLAGAGAALTKQPGAVVLLPLLWELWQREGAGVRVGGPWRLVRPLAGLALTPLGLLGWIVYRATLGDVSFAWRDPASLVGALLVTPSYESVWGEHFSWPWVNFQHALAQLSERPYFYLIANLFVMLLMLALTLAAAARQGPSYGIYGVVLALMNLSIVYPLWPYMGIIRRFTIIFPMFVQLAVWGRSRAVTALVLAVNTLLWVLISSMYVRNAFVP